MAPNTRHLSRLVWLACAVLPVVPLGVVGKPAPAQAQKMATTFGPRLSPIALLTGFELVKGLPPSSLGINFTSNYFKVDARLSINEKKDSRIEELEGRLATASEEQRKLLEIQLQQLQILSETEKTANDYRRRMLDHQTRLFEYQQGVLRKERYDVPVDKLVVVVADFSSGEPARGREVADELAAQIKGLRPLGIDVHVLVGEIKPGVVIRSEELAQDVGKHFPPHTSYVVLWGSMSELTTGNFRAHVTCAYKRNDQSGVSASHTLDLEPQELPAPGSGVSTQRDQYNKLISIACAVVPKCYVAYRVNRDEEPKLSGLYAYLGRDKPVVKELQSEVTRISTWARNRPSNVARLSAIADKAPYPKQIASHDDGSLMTLITDEGGAPRMFEDRLKNKKYIAYIDTGEISIKQFVSFLNAKGNQEDGGASWYKLDADPNWKYIVEDPPGKFAPRWSNYITAPVVNVSFFGARAYCAWANKHLPTKEEWLAAATRGNLAYPWGEKWDDEAAKWKSDSDQEGYPSRTGLYAKDKSPIGCYDMAGNVAEWCEDFADQQKGERVICGGSFNDDKSALDVRKTRQVAQVRQERWLGFRGVMRIYLQEER